jgi:hypothetical protein
MLVMKGPSGDEYLDALTRAVEAALKATAS